MSGKILKMPATQHIQCEKAVFKDVNNLTLQIDGNITNEYKEYKGGRNATPDDLIKQMPLARELLKAMGIFYYEEEGYEASEKTRLAGIIDRPEQRK